MKFDNMVILAVIVAIIILTMGAFVYTSSTDITTNNITEVNDTKGNATHNDTGLLSWLSGNSTSSGSSSSSSHSSTSSSSSSSGSSSSYSGGGSSSSSYSSGGSSSSSGSSSGGSSSGGSSSGGSSSGGTPAPSHDYNIVDDE